MYTCCKNGLLLLPGNELRNRKFSLSLFVITKLYSKIKIYHVLGKNYLQFYQNDLSATLNSDVFENKNGFEKIAKYNVFAYVWKYVGPTECNSK